MVRGDSGFARDGLMDWCERHGAYYVLGLAKNQRLLQKIGNEMVEAHTRHRHTGHAARAFAHFHWTTRTSWTRPRRVIAKAEHLGMGANPRFIVTNLPRDYATPQSLYEEVYCARSDMENRIKEQQLDLFADRTSTHTMCANQLRLWLSTLANATCGAIRFKLLKLGAHLVISVRHFVIRLASACPCQDVFRHAWLNLQRLPLTAPPGAQGKGGALSRQRENDPAHLNSKHTKRSTLKTEHKNSISMGL